MAVCKLIQNSQTKFKLKKNRVLYGRVQKALRMGVTYNSENYFIPHYQDGVAWSGGATLPRWQLSGFTPSNLGKVTKWSLLFATWSRVEYDVDPPDEHLTANTSLCGVSQLTNMKLWDNIHRAILSKNLESFTWSHPGAAEVDYSPPLWSKINWHEALQWHMTSLKLYWHLKS